MPNPAPRPYQNRPFLPRAPTHSFALLLRSLLLAEREAKLSCCFPPSPPSSVSLNHSFTHALFFFFFLLSLFLLSRFTKKARASPPLSLSLSSLSSLFLSSPLRARRLERLPPAHVPPRPLAEPVRARVPLDAGPELGRHDAPPRAAVALDPVLLPSVVVLFAVSVVPWRFCCCCRLGFLPFAALGLLLLPLL